MKTVLKIGSVLIAISLVTVGVILLGHPRSENNNLTGNYPVSNPGAHPWGEIRYNSTAPPGNDSAPWHPPGEHPWQDSG